MSEETSERLMRYLEGDEGLPQRVTNAMLLIALRAERDARRREGQAVRELLAEHTRLLLGSPPEEGAGLLGSVARLERLVTAGRWLLLPVASAFLGALGAWLFGTAIK